MDPGLKRIPRGQKTLMPASRVQSFLKSRARLIRRLENKDFRDEYVRGHVEQGLAFQIAALRKERKWTQKDLADRLGTKQAFVSRLEDPSHCKHSTATLMQLQKVFDVALMVCFVPYSQFIQAMDDVSEQGISVRSFDEDLRETFPDESPEFDAQDCGLPQDA